MAHPTHGVEHFAWCVPPRCRTQRHDELRRRAASCTHAGNASARGSVAVGQVAIVANDVATAWVAESATASGSRGKVSRIEPVRWRQIERSTVAPAVPVDHVRFPKVTAIEPAHLAAAWAWEVSSPLSIGGPHELAVALPDLAQRGTVMMFGFAAPHDAIT